MLWPKNLDKNIKPGVKLASYTTFKIGGAARFFFEPDTLQELRDALIFARAKRIPVFILGAGSNILASDTGLNALVIRLSGKDFKGLAVNGVHLQAGSGLKISRLLTAAKKRSLSGLEFLAGIPGTLGGGLMGNAGAWGKSIGDMVEEVSVLDYNGKAKLLKKSRLEFGYRRSNLGKYIITGAKLKLTPGKPSQISSLIRGLLKQRSLSQENNLPSAGCVFKNPTALWPAGKLIEACGLKGRAAGGAVISPVHANFILNRGRAKSKDVLSLMRLSAKEVEKKFKVKLEPEIKIWK
ncbi:MAG: UDP-N-acetylmuramate dehydrogenase [Candidatus Omnitrophica bacterium]|nr:UDP-N-acetylmuramate dehydrogenase [Candidatus Omnitrophota bacterium]